MPSYRLNSPTGEFSAFGQMYQRYGRINLARLVVNPQMRGKGIGKRLVASLIGIGSSLFDANEFSLFSYRHNAAALGCYQSMGFVIHDYPEGAPMADECFYLIRPV
jgi:ribosomal protein S18 acetylase RimI-like enzyme